MFAPDVLHLIAQATAPSGPAGLTNALPSGDLWALFRQSFDAFTVLLIAGSLTGVTLIFLCLLEVREGNIAPADLCARMTNMATAGRVDELRDITQRDDSFVSRIVRASLAYPGADRTTLREAAELAASEESARWFRKIDMLNVIGNLGPLVGLAGTVWGMILAFTSLGASGGTAGPADLSMGISKALFHTLLGLCLAIPCLLTYSMFRARIDRLCTRAIVIASDIVEKLPAAPPPAAPAATTTLDAARPQHATL
ncbi:MAG: MotA/TolQ/ExbB proton channel family protein [Phycisphaerales bacterium]